MKRFVLVPLALLAMATSARGQAPGGAPAPEPPVMKRSGPGQATQHRLVTVKAKVTAVDIEKRTVTVAGKDGKAETFAVGPEVKRLGEIAPGDVIVVKYEQGLLLQFAPEGVKSPEPSDAVHAERAGADAPPGGSAMGQVRGTVTVTAVDQKTRTVVLETPKGELFKVKADPSINLKNVKSGQKYDGVYSESVAVSVEKAKPPQKKPPQKM